MIIFVKKSAMQTTAIAVSKVIAKTPAPKRTRRRLTYKDYAAMTPPDNGNYELINGNIVFMPSPTPQHQRVLRRLTGQIENYLLTSPVGEVFFAPLDVFFDETNTLQPDILFIRKERAGIIGEKKIEGAPDFVVEILSEGNTSKEMTFKKYVYESFQVREYWLINLAKQTITQYLNEEGEFQKTGVFKAGEALTSVVLSGFSTKFEDLL